MQINKKIIDKLKQRDEYAFDIVYEKYNKLIYLIIYEVTYDVEAAKDLSQETFIKMLDNIDTFEYVSQSAFRNWLCLIAKTLVANYIRDKKEDVITDELLEEQMSYENDFKKKASLYFPNLAYEEIQLLYMYYQCKMSFAEIADYYNESKINIYRRIKRIESKMEDK